VPAQERVEQNERLFREVNERIAEVTERVLDGYAADADFYCECARKACLERVRLTLAEYRGVRTHPRHFVLVVGHELPEFEDVVRREAGYIVVEKPVA
jgi:hypothetical protein